MTQQPVFPLAHAPDVDLEQEAVQTWTVDETFTAPEQIQLDRTSRAAITSAVDIVACGRSKSRSGGASCNDVYFADAECAVAVVDRVRGRSDRDRDRQGLLPWRHGTVGVSV